MMPNSSEDSARIRELVEQWVIYSDSGDWQRFSSLWHEDGWMTATWLDCPAQEFVQARREGFERGANVVHFLGGFTCDVVGDRAIAQTKMCIVQRAMLEGVLADATCMGRFYDFFALRSGRWGMVRRQPIYERDRIDAVEPGVSLRLDKILLMSFPDGYRHLAYLQTKAGYTVNPSLPGVRGPEVQRLYAEGQAWLAGEECDFRRRGGR